MAMTLNDLIDTFRSALSLPETVEVPALRYRAVPQWNSLGHMQLVAALESRFDVILETDDILDLSSFDKAVEILAKNHVALEA